MSNIRRGVHGIVVRADSPRRTFEEFVAAACDNPGKLGVSGPRGLDPAIVKKLHDAMKDALFDPATQAAMERYSMPTLHLDTAAYDAASREQDKIERENLRRVNMLAR